MLIANSAFKAFDERVRATERRLERQRERIASLVDAKTVERTAADRSTSDGETVDGQR